MPSTSAIIFLSAAVFGVAVVVVSVVAMELPPVHTTSAQGSACRHIVIVTSTMALVVTWLTRKQNDGKGSLGLLEGRLSIRSRCLPLVIVRTCYLSHVELRLIRAVLMVQLRIQLSQPQVWSCATTITTTAISITMATETIATTQW